MQSNSAHLQTHYIICIHTHTHTHKRRPGELSESGSRCNRVKETNPQLLVRPLITHILWLDCASVCVEEIDVRVHVWHVCDFQYFSHVSVRCMQGPAAKPSDGTKDLSWELWEISRPKNPRQNKVQGASFNIDWCSRLLFSNYRYCRVEGGSLPRLSV